MRIKPRPLQISDDTGFDPSIDIFKRGILGERLANLLENAEESLIIGIDGQWGEGKSTFARMLKGHLKTKKSVTTIYFDAFEHDYQKDPFLAIAAQIIDQTEATKNQVASFKKSAIRVTKTIFRGALRVGIKAVSAGALDETTLEDLDISKDVGDELSAGVDKFLSEKLESSREEKNALDNFKKELESFITAAGNGKPITFIIDELDRCRPDFCVELIEQIKHLFTVKNLNFLIVTNKSQIATTIKNKYGKEINAHLYLQKFIDLWISLPRTDDRYENHARKYLGFLLPRVLNEGEKTKNNDIFEILEKLFSINKTSLRGIEKTISYVAILQNSTDSEYYGYYQAAIAVSCYCKAEKPEILKLLIESRDHNSIIEQILTSTEFDESSIVEYTKNIIRYCLGTDEEKQKMREEEHYNSREFPRGNPFASVAISLDGLHLQ